METDKRKIYTDEDGNIYMEGSVKGEDGHLWMLSPRDYHGKSEDKDLQLIGEFRVCY